ncbi:MAG: hypothetical protein E7653_08080 [Ruminococcaceae bacterium]|nr:hypothetical protein [Oscillospiraceae bacterium]
MKSLIEKLKSVPKKTLALIGLLIILSISTLIMSIVVAKQARAKNDASVSQGGTSVGVFNDTDTKQEQTQKVELDLTDVYGLKFVSRGDGTCSVAGIGSCLKTEFEIPTVSPDGDKVTKIDDNAFTNCKELVSVTIPSTVKTVGTGAFRGCEKLVAVNVSPDNEVYCSIGGVLFSKDKTVLICYPMNRQGINYLLSTDVKAIGAFAFEGAINLTQLLYQGSVSSFNDIDILAGNDILDSIAITCNYSGAK